jgi:acyl carrier protein
MQLESTRQSVFPGLSSLFNLPVERLDDASSRATLEAWDSLKHMHLVLALEDEFGIEFSDDEIANLDSAGRLIAAVSNKLHVQLSGWDSYIWNLHDWYADA